MRISGRGLTEGSAQGRLALLDAPLSLWGGLDLDTGAICDVTHPQHGLSLTGRVLAMRGARGSSSSSSALVEAVRRGTAPAAVVLTAADPILVIGALVAADLYAARIPILLVAAEDWPRLQDGAEISVSSGEGADGLTF
jgi:predicted aconitase with swiveling domain